MDVKRDRRAERVKGEHVVSRPHLPAYLWYGCWAVLLGVLTASVLRRTAWDGSLMMIVPIGMAVAFGVPLLLALRNLTSVAIVEMDAVELRRFFMRAWRLQRRDVFRVKPTPGIIEGPLRLGVLGAPDRAIPGFLMRGMRGTWVDDLRHAPSTGGLAAMSPEERDAFIVSVKRKGAENDETLGASPAERWQNRLRWDKEMHFVNGVSVALTFASLLLPPFRELWALDVLIVFAALVTAVRARLRYRGLKHSFRETGPVIVSLLPGAMFTRVQFDWQIVDSGLGTMALCVAGVIWLTGLTPPWRGIFWTELDRYVIVSMLMFGLTAFWADEMLTFANMRFDATRMPVVEVANVLRIEKSASSRSTPASVVVDLGSTTTLAYGLKAQFLQSRMPAGELRVGGQCVVMVHPGLLGVRWAEVAVCR